ncbi:CotY/CotZ family spore coat protein [Litchfieldia salsa]|uniref:Spore coat protein Z n=1 Tax=Litchfieldia salsa TaxID=930152 RepID=A0A1H0WQN4_9BACI|nr:CotY/CotZ family spore coat protein [Litchfieldia salsa]SDP93030.1 Spore coat protein Z [Litchfieldia salsa]
MSSSFYKKDECKTFCICETLEKIKLAQEEAKEAKKSALHHCLKDLDENRLLYDTVPFILQTPYGHPYFTWGNFGDDDCFITVFFKVVDIDCENCCAKLQLLKPNKPIYDDDTGSVELDQICKVDYVTETKECVFVELKCYSAIKCLDPSFVQVNPKKKDCY